MKMPICEGIDLGNLVDLTPSPFDEVERGMKKELATYQSGRVLDNGRRRCNGLKEILLPRLDNNLEEDGIFNKMCAFYRF